MKVQGKGERQLRSRIMAAVRSKHTRPELTVRSLLHRLGYRFRLHDRRLPGCPDIVLPKHRCIVLVNGCFWHQHPRCRRAKLPAANAEFWTPKLKGNRQRDLLNLRRLRRDGWRVAIVWECETMRGETDGIATRLDKFIGGKRRRA
jgi:DNA mismatch endonuclease (patch repair protein)